MARNRGTPRPRARNINKDILSEEEHLVRENALFMGPPLITAIIGAAMVEYELDDLLRYKLYRNDEQTWSLITGDTGPLTTLSAKIVLGYALNIYDDIAMNNLNIVRTVRNAFAHAYRVVDFDNPLISVELQKIQVPSETNSRRSRHLADARDLKYGGFAAYVTLCTELSTMLMTRIIRLARNKQKYYEQSANAAQQFVFANILEHPELSKFVQQWYRANQADDPMTPTLGPVQHRSFGRLPKLARLQLQKPHPQEGRLMLGSVVAFVVSA